MAILIWLCLAAEAGASSLHPSCSRFSEAELTTVPQAIYVPALLEEQPYSLTSPGQLAPTHTAALRDVLERAYCISRARQVPFGTLRLTVIARTDDRGARDYLLRVLRGKGVPPEQLDAAGRMIVDVVAAWHRARLIVEALRNETGQFLRADPSLGSGDPAGMVQPGELTSDDAGSTRLYGATEAIHPRSFVVAISVRDSAAAGSAVGPWTATGPSGALPAINIQFSGAPTRTAEPEPKKSSDLPDAIQGSLVGSPELDVVVGAVIPVQSYTRTQLFKDLGVLALGLRLPIYRLELGVRLSFLFGEHSVLFSGTPVDQLRLGASAVLQAGALLVRAACSGAS